MCRSQGTVIRHQSQNVIFFSHTQGIKLPDDKISQAVMNKCRSTVQNSAGIPKVKTQKIDPVTDAALQALVAPNVARLKRYLPELNYTGWREYKT